MQEHALIRAAVTVYSNWGHVIGHVKRGLGSGERVTWLEALTARYALIGPGPLPHYDDNTPYTKPYTRKTKYLHNKSVHKGSHYTCRLSVDTDSYPC